MASSVPEILLEALQGLGRENLKLFHWYLINGVEGFKCIPAAQLEKPELTDTVDKMIQRHERSGAVEITLAILKKINQNQLAVDLQIKTEENEDRCEKKHDRTPAASFTTAENGDAVKASAPDEQHRNQLISKLSHIYERILIGNSQTGHKEYLDDVYTDLIVVPNESGGVIHRHEMMQLELSHRPGGEETFVKCSDLFKDSGVKLLSGGLKSSQCKLEVLRLSGCLVTDESCSSLALALSSNPSHLKELDLAYNNPGHSRANMLSARLEDPRCKLKMLRLEHAGKNRIKPGLRKCKFYWVKCNFHSHTSTQPKV
ncbi:hypothetical protein AOLI_G00080990 [Acnodon oligacanthus]